MNHDKYRAYPPMNLPDRKWPGAVITKAPIWSSVDLRDGNQALPIPMGVEKKLVMFGMLREIGFKEIEVAFPSASNTDFSFVRTLIERGMAEGITLQVLTQAREHLIRRTYDALAGCKSAIMHFYNSTSTAQRRVVFRMEKAEILKIAVDGATLVKQLASETDCDIRFEYSPESFTGTEMAYAREVCEAVMDVLQPTPDRKVIINLPATVEMATPNVYADQIEWFCRNLSGRESAIISLHAHNDRGTAVAATELGLMAGADRVEGTLFGNGERTGNVDIFNLAMNLYSQGIDPGLKITSVDGLIGTYEACTGMTVNQRHPWVGELVYTAFSGSHQDAIRKGLKEYADSKPEFWDVPYLPIDPQDIGRQYEAVIRINSQSGKGGVAFVMEQEFGYHLPKAMHPEFGSIIKSRSDSSGMELAGSEIFDAFQETYLSAEMPYSLAGYRIDSRNGTVSIESDLLVDGQPRKISGTGNGPISAFFNGLKSALDIKAIFVTYEEHALGSGETAEAVAYIELLRDGKAWFGVGRDRNTTTAAFRAILSALNRMDKA
jgi:2-isopropylmalate synthase